MNKKLADINFMSNYKTVNAKALDMLKDMRLVAYDADSGPVGGKRYTIPGQDMMHIPGAVEVDCVNMVYADHTALIPFLVAAVNKLNERIKDLEKASSRASKFE